MLETDITKTPSLFLSHIPGFLLKSFSTILQTYLIYSISSLQFNVIWICFPFAAIPPSPSIIPKNSANSLLFAGLFISFLLNKKLLLNLPFSFHHFLHPFILFGPPMQPYFWMHAA